MESNGIASLLTLPGPVESTNQGDSPMLLSIDDGLRVQGPRDHRPSTVLQIQQVIHLVALGFQLEDPAFLISKPRDQFIRKPREVIQSQAV